LEKDVHAMRIVKILFVCHLIALVFGLGALLIVAPHAVLLEHTPLGSNGIPFVLRSAGPVQILLGASTMLVFGMFCIGPHKTLIFFAASMLIALRLEGTGMSNPYTMSLSWFYMGFTSYLLASALTTRLRLHWQTLWSLLLGTYFLVSWNLALNSALESQRPISPGNWQGYGASVGTPPGNLPGWILGSILILSVSRLLWRANPDLPHLVIWLPSSLYAANTGFTLILHFGVGLWFPLCLSVLCLLLPELLVLLPGEEARVARNSSARTALSQLLWLVMRVGDWIIVRRALEIHVEGLGHVPRSGPVLIAARHFHYFYDGVIILKAIPRRLHTIVALDWVRARSLRLMIELGCSLADWLVILRSEQFHTQDGDRGRAYAPNEARHYLRQMTLGAIRLLRSGEVLLIFPEGYPNIDPHPTPKTDLEAFLPFQPGFVKLAEQAERDGQTQVAIIPTGLTYTRLPRNRWRVTVRFGPALFRRQPGNTEQLLHSTEEYVHTLSALALPP